MSKRGLKTSKGHKNRSSGSYPQSERPKSSLMNNLLRNLPGHASTTPIASEPPSPLSFDKLFNGDTCLKGMAEKLKKLGLLDNNCVESLESVLMKWTLLHACMESEPNDRKQVWKECFLLLPLDYDVLKARMLEKLPEANLEANEYAEYARARYGCMRARVKVCETYGDLLGIVEKFRPPDALKSKDELEMIWKIDEFLKFRLDEYEPGKGGAWLSQDPVILEYFNKDPTTTWRSLSRLRKDRIERRIKLRKKEKKLGELGNWVQLNGDGSFLSYGHSITSLFGLEELSGKSIMEVMSEYFRCKCSWAERESLVKRLGKGDPDMDDYAEPFEKYFSLLDQYDRLVRDFVGHFVKTFNVMANDLSRSGSGGGRIELKKDCLAMNEYQVELDGANVVLVEVGVRCDDLFQIIAEKQEENLVMQKDQNGKSFPAILAGFTPNRAHTVGSCDLHFEVVTGIVAHVSLASGVWRCRFNTKNEWQSLGVVPLGQVVIEGSLCYRLALLVKSDNDHAQIKSLVHHVGAGLSEGASILLDCLKMNCDEAEDLGDIVHFLSPSCRFNHFQNIDLSMKNSRTHDTDQESERVAKEAVLALMGARFSFALIKDGEAVRFARELIEQWAKVPLMSVTVEYGNFQAFLRRLRMLRGISTLSFFVVQFVESLPPTYYQRLLEVVAQQSVRVLLIEREGIESSFDLLGRKDEIFIPERTAVSQQRCVFNYPKEFAVELEHDKVSLEEIRNQLRESIQERLSWKEREKHWRITCSSGKFLLLVSDAIDFDDYYSTQNVERLFCGADNIDVLMQNLVEKLTQNKSIVVFIGSNLISAAQRAFFMKQVMDCGCGVIMVSPVLHPSFTTLALEGMQVEASQVVQALDLDEGVRARRMLLGPVDRGELFSQEELAERWTARMRGAPSVRESLRKMMQGQTCLLSSMLKALETSCIESDVSFYQFVTECSYCQVLSQRDRVKLWLRVVLEQSVAETLIQELPKGSGTHSLHLIPFLCEEDKPSSYECLLKQASMDEQELLVEQCTQNEELHWEQLWRDWADAFPHSLDIALTCIKFYAFPFKFLLAMGPKSLFFCFAPAKPASLSVSVVRKLEEAVKLAQCCIITSNRARASLAVLRWIMATKVGGKQYQVSGVDLQLLLDYNIPITIPSYELDPDACIQLLNVLFVLDEPPSVLFDQASLRNGIMSLSAAALSRVLPHLRLGRSFWEFCLHRETVQRGGCICKHDLVRPVVDWAYHDALDSKFDLDRCSDSAVAFFLLWAKPDGTCPLSLALLQLDAVRFASILNLALNDKALSRSLLVRLVLLKDSRLNLDKYFVWILDFLDGKIATPPPASVPFHCHDRLREAFSKHAQIFLNFYEEGGEEELLDACLKVKPVNRELVYKLWEKCPHVVLPDSFPAPEDRDQVKRLRKDRDFKLRVQRHLRSTSSLAIFIAAPGYLHTSSLNEFLSRLGEEIIPYATFNVAQKKDAARVYVLSVAPRPVPKSFEMWLMKQELRLTILTSRSEYCFLEIFSQMDVESGVSLQIVERNLSAFCSLFAPRAFDAQDKTSVHDATEGVLRYVLCCFFAAAGLSIKDLFHQKCRSSVRLPQMVKDIEKYIEELPRPNFQEGVLCPMPNRMETSLLNSEASLSQFGGSGRANLMYTKQLLSSFSDQYRSVEDAKDWKHVVERFACDKISEKLGNLRDLEASLDPFLWTLRQICEAPQNRCIEREIFKVFLEHLVVKIQPDPVQSASLSRALIMPLVGSKSQRVQDFCAFALMTVLNRLKYFCEATYKEIKWMNQEGFPAPLIDCDEKWLKSYKRSVSNLDLDIDRIARDSDDAWEWEFEGKESTAEAASAPSVPVVVANLLQEQVSKIEAPQKSLPVLATTPFKPSVSRARIDQGSNIFQAPVFVDARDLLELQHGSEKFPFGSIQVKPGLNGLLVKSDGMFSYRNLNRTRDDLGNEESVLVFSSNVSAWQWLDTSLKPLSVVWLDKVFLRKEVRGRFWVPIFGGDIAGFHGYTIPFWRVLGIYRLAGFDLCEHVAFASVAKILHLMREALVFLKAKSWNQASCPLCFTEGKFSTWALLNAHLDVANHGSETCINKYFLELHHRSPDYGAMVTHTAKLRDLFKECMEGALRKVVNVESLVHKKLAVAGSILSQLGSDSELAFASRLSHLMQVAGEYALRLAWEILFEDSSSFFSKIMTEMKTNMAWVNSVSPAEELIKAASSKEPGLEVFPFRLCGNGCAASFPLQVLSLAGLMPLCHHPVPYRLTIQRSDSVVVSVLLPLHVFPKTLGQELFKPFSRWLAQVIQSPLDNAHKEWMCSLIRMNAITSTDIKWVRDLPSAPLAVRIVLHALALACPFEPLRLILLGAFPIPADIEPYTRLKSPPACFSLYFVDSHCLSDMRKLSLPVEVLDLHVANLSGSLSRDEQYLRVISRFDSLTCYVYIRGLAQLDDLFLKWLAEHTKHFPWRYVFIESADPTYNFAETRDRSFTHFFTPPTLTEWRLGKSASRMDINRIDYSKRHVASFSSPDAILSAYWPDDTEAKPREAILESITVEDGVDLEQNWYDQLGPSLLQPGRDCVVLLQSPPGAGKTYTVDTKLRHEFELQGFHVADIDCSDDRLVVHSLLSTLHEMMPSDVKKGLLVADEYHFLSKSHKRMLFEWIGARNSDRIVVLLIANRVDSFDKMLMDGLRQPNLTQYIRIWPVCLTRQYILSYYSKTEKVNAWTDLWARSSRALFGEEILSMRIVPLVQKAMDNHLELAKVLLDKMPSLGAITTLEYSMHLCQFFQDLCGRRNLKAVVTSPFRLLVRASCLANTPYQKSFPSFVRSLKKAYDSHPLARLCAWVWALYKKCPSEPMPDLSPLLRLRVIDQQGFPLVVSVTSHMCSPWIGEAFSRPGDYTQLSWMKSSIQKGYAIDWKKVRALWALHFVTDVAAFEELLSACPDPSSCLSALDPKNLCVLIERSGFSLWETVVQFSDCDEVATSAALSTVDSPLFNAAWRLTLRDEIVPSRVDDLKLLIWASKFTPKVSTSDPCAKLLKRLLLERTTVVLEDYDQSRLSLSQCADIVTSLWGYAFQRLLSFGVHESLEHCPYLVAFLICKCMLSSVRGGEWAPKERHLLSNLSDLMLAIPTALRQLRGHQLWRRHRQRFSRPFFEEDPSFPAGFRLGSIVLSMAQARLDMDWQLLVLHDPDELVLPREMRAEDILEVLKHAILELESPDRILVNCKIRRFIKEELEGSRNVVPTGWGSWSVGAGQEKRLQFRMRYLKRLFGGIVNDNTCKILSYFTETTMATSEERIREGSDEDPLKGTNPSDKARFDLGLGKAFTKFLILIGCFYTYDNFEEKFKGKFEGIIREQLCGGLGFQVRHVYTEEEFIRECLPEKYHVAFIISSNSVDWLMRDINLSDNHWTRFSEAVSNFHRHGRGLLIMGEEEPLVDHANCALGRIARGALLGGKLDGEGELILSKFLLCQAPDCRNRVPSSSESRFCTMHQDCTKYLPKSCGTFDENPITGSLNSLFEGTTICHTKKLGALVSFAKSSDKVPQNCLFYATPEDDTGEKLRGTLPKGAGRIIVDTGFTKLWVEFGTPKGEGTDRYIRNAAVWLTGVDYRIAHNLDERQPLTLCQLDAQVPHFLPEINRSVLMDIIVCIDGSVSVGSQGFADAKHSIIQLAEKVDFRLCRMGLIQFSSGAALECGLCSSKEAIVTAAKNMRFQEGGTNFARAFREIAAEWTRNGRKSNGLPLGRFVVLFQTDGEDGSRDREDALRELKQSRCEIIALGVGPSVNENMLRQLGKYISVSDYSKLAETLTTTFTALSDKYRKL